MFRKLAYYDIKRNFEYSNSAGVRNPFVLFGYDVSAFSLAWSEPFVLSLYKCDTTRMVGRPVNSTAISTSLYFRHRNSQDSCQVQSPFVFSALQVSTSPTLLPSSVGCSWSYCFCFCWPVVPKYLNLVVWFLLFCRILYVLPCVCSLLVLSYFVVCVGLWVWECFKVGGVRFPGDFGELATLCRCSLP